MRITGIAVFVPTETAPKPLNVRCAMLEREPRQGNAWQYSICLFFVITVWRTENYLQCFPYVSRVMGMLLLSAE